MTKPAPRLRKPVWVTFALVFVIFEIVVNFGGLSGASGFLGVFLPGLVLIAAAVGFLLASCLKNRSPADFAKLGSQQI